MGGVTNLESPASHWQHSSAPASDWHTSPNHPRSHDRVRRQKCAATWVCNRSGPAVHRRQSTGRQSGRNGRLKFRVRGSGASASIVAPRREGVSLWALACWTVRKIVCMVVGVHGVVAVLCSISGYGSSWGDVRSVEAVVGRPSRRWRG